MAEQVTLQFPDGAFSVLRRSPAEFADEVPGFDLTAIWKRGVGFRSCLGHIGDPTTWCPQLFR